MSSYLHTAIEKAAALDSAAVEALDVAGAPATGLDSQAPQAIEGYRSDPTGTACTGQEQPGARALARELGARFRGRAEIYNCRAVRGGKRLSLHGEGRAIDWYRNVRDPAEAAEAQRILDWLLGPDVMGNEHALARRMGIQEIIWNRRIWTARRHAEGWRDYSGVNPHTDHLHIGLTWPGARMETSFWRAGATGVRAIQLAVPNKAGWTGPGVPHDSWNAGARDVGTIRRVPIEGLTLGNQQEFAGAERAKTGESAAGRAIVLVPAGLDPDQPVDVLLHLHGYTGRPSDPYAGWRQHSVWGTVRDVHQDRIEGQMQATGINQMVAVLPQGVGRSEFGRLPVGAYLKEVLGSLVAVHELRKQPAAGELKPGRLILGAHSGGGDRIAPMLGGATGKDAAEVVLFEAIHLTKNWNGLRPVLDWATYHLERVRKVLASPETSPTQRRAVIDACPQLHGYYSAKVEDDPGSGNYVRTYRALDAALDQWFTHNAKDLGSDFGAVRARFEVTMLTGVSHETIVRGLGDDPAAGPLTHALTALNYPTGPSKLAPTPATITVSRGVIMARPMSDEKAKAIARAIKQATTAGTAQDRADLAETIVYNGRTIESWFADIVPDATFLGVHITASGGDVHGVHLELYKRLQLAEEALRKLHPDLSDAQIAEYLHLKEISGIRPPAKATGGSLPSFHCFGLAVDINYPTNPFVGYKKPVKGPKYQEYLANRSPRIIERAMQLLHHEAFNVEAELKVPKGSVNRIAAIWEIHHRASEALAEYLRLADDLDGHRLVILVESLNRTGDTRGLTWWKQRIADDRRLIKYWDFEHHPAAEKSGYMDLPKELVEALVGAGLLWGGTYPGSKDIMHFDWRHGTINKRPSKQIPPRSGR